MPRRVSFGAPLRHRVLPELPLPFRRQQWRQPFAGKAAGEESLVREGLSILGRTAAAAREEVLEELWSAAEAGVTLTVHELARTIHAGASEGWGGVVQELVEQGLVELVGDRLSLTPAGVEQARAAARRHRLAEVLFHQVLDLPMATTEQEACRIEHVLSPQATEAVCSFLGHPPVCPHGRPIPPGECCRSLSRRTVEPLISRLADLAPGERGKVVLLAPRHRQRLEQLTDLGVIPGAVVVLRQRKPSLVVEVDRTLLALDDDIAEGIYLRPLQEW